MNKSYNPSLRSKNARKPDTYCAGAALKAGQWYALIADGWKAKGVRNPLGWIASGKASEAATIQFGEEHVQGLLQERGLCLNQSQSPQGAHQSEKRSEELASSSPAEAKAAAGLQQKDASTDASPDCQAPGLATTVWVGIDGGVSGAAAALYPDGIWEAHPVAVGLWNQDRVLDIPENTKLLEGIANKAGGLNNMFVAYERARKNKKFGIYNLFQIGRNDEFWRVLLSVRNIPFCDVDPRTWQSFCLGARGQGDTKVRALGYVRQRFPNCDWLDDYNKEQRKGIVDAMCIAMWAAATKGSKQQFTRAA